MEMRTSELELLALLEDLPGALVTEGQDFELVVVVTQHQQDPAHALRVVLSASTAALARKPSFDNFLWGPGIGTGDSG